MPRDQTFQALKLLSQYIVSDLKKIPEGETFQRTSCMNPDDAENMGNILFLKKIIGNKNPKFKKFIDEFLIPYFETMGIAKWQHGELTHLGFRAGIRYEENVSGTEIDEAAVYESEAGEAEQ